MKILLVEDNKSISDNLKYTFNINNIDLDVTNNIKSTKDYLEYNKPSLIILDVTLPDGNGFDLYKSELSKMNIPVIFLTACDTEENIVEVLNMGASDYITKPFRPLELIARINKILHKKTIKIKDITIDMNKMIVTKNNEIINLTTLEYKILNLLIENINKVVTRDRIIDSIWEWTGNDVNDNTITVYMKRIREKLNSDIIVTIKGIGYRIDEE
ncbi:response regulators consisting of a CheY-like receiver domain and a winged-helix DNA-binding domain [Clostridium sp. CAG:524]|nr:response regulators consisting of a CheY-like receiver domain and a winged-helix DNA-binding domain [Clostridium sp. CAG:524]